MTLGVGNYLTFDIQWDVGRARAFFERERAIAAGPHADAAPEATLAVDLAHQSARCAPNVVEAGLEELEV